MIVIDISECVAWETNNQKSVLTFESGLSTHNSSIRKLAIQCTSTVVLVLIGASSRSQRYFSRFRCDCFWSMCA